MLLERAWLVRLRPLAPALLLSAKPSTSETSITHQGSWRTLLFYLNKFLGDRCCHMLALYAAFTIRPLYSIKFFVKVRLVKQVLETI